MVAAVGVVEACYHLCIGQGNKIDTTLQTGDAHAQLVALPNDAHALLVALATEW